MRYSMKQALFSFGDDFVVKDDNGNKIARVDGKLFSIGQKLVFEDMNGRELVVIKETLLSLRPVYEILRDGKLIAEVKKDFFNFLRCSFTVDVPGPDDLEARGSFTDHEYTFSRDGRHVATVSKTWLSLTDSYGVDVVDGEDAILILASTVVIDMCCHADKKKKHAD